MSGSIYWQFPEAFRNLLITSCGVAIDSQVPNHKKSFLKNGQNNISEVPLGSEGCMAEAVAAFWDLEQNLERHGMN